MGRVTLQPGCMLEVHSLVEVVAHSQAEKEEVRSLAEEGVHSLSAEEVVEDDEQSFVEVAAL